MKFKEKKLSSNVLYSGKAISFNVDEILLPNNKKATREYINHPGASAVLCVEDEKFIMVKQYRYPIGETTYEIPAGKLHSKDDDFLLRAKEELKEETGYTAKKFTHLVTFWPTPAFSNEVLKIYLAEGLSKGKSNCDEDEFLDVIKVPIKKAADMIRKSMIKDSKTIIAILYYLYFFKKGEDYE
jgi:ADP-ribose pyrophosphatase